MYNTILTPSTSATLRQSWRSLLADKAFVTIGDPSGAIGETATASANEQMIANRVNVMTVKLFDSDIVPSCKRIAWVTGKVYSAYRATVVENIHVETTAGALTHVFKCLGNNSGGVSTVQPAVVNQTVPFTTADGYVWMYLFTVSEQNKLMFATDDALPVTANATVAAAAVGGTIDTYVIEDKGLGYLNTIAGTFAQSDVRVGSATAYKLGAAASSTDDFYNGCRLEITSGAAAGLNAVITDYVGSTRTATIDVAFTTAPNGNDNFEVSPNVSFVVNAGAVAPTARAIITNGQVTSIRPLSRGKNIRSATASIVSHFSATPTVEAELTVHASPYFGHGSNAEVEVNANGLLIGKEVDLATAGLPRAGNIGTTAVIVDPRFNAVELTVTKPLLFNAGEQLAIATPVGRISANAVVSNTALTINDTPSAQIEIGTPVIVVDGTRQVVTKIAGQTNSTSYSVSPSIATSATGTLLVACDHDIANVASVAADKITVSNAPLLGTGDAVYGLASGQGSTVTTVNAVGSGNFFTATDVWTLNGTLASGSITAGQVATQGSNSAIVFSKNANNTSLFLVGKNATFAAGTVTTPSGSFTVSSVAAPMTNLETGSLVVVSTFAPVNINNNKFYCKHHLLI